MTGSASAAPAAAAAPQPADAGVAFIVGHRKSGSTWLLNLVSLHPDVRGLSETSLFRLAWSERDPRPRTERLFTRTPWSGGGLGGVLRRRVAHLAAPIARRYRPAIDLAPHERPNELADLPLGDTLRLRRELRSLEDPVAFVRCFFARQRELLHAPALLIEKSPRHVRFLDHVQAAFPGAPLVAIHRDGRDVVTSDRFFTERHLGQKFDFAAAVRGWQEDIEAESRAAERWPLFSCSYEQLKSDGVAVARRLFRFLGLAHDPVLLAGFVERASFRRWAGRAEGEEDPRRFYRKGVVGDWRNHFTPAEKETFKEIAGQTLVDLGYERDLAW